MTYSFIPSHSLSPEKFPESFERDIAENTDASLLLTRDLLFSLLNTAFMTFSHAANPFPLTDTLLEKLPHIALAFHASENPVLDLPITIRETINVPSEELNTVVTLPQTDSQTVLQVSLPIENIYFDLFEDQPTPSLIPENNNQAPEFSLSQVINSIESHLPQNPGFVFPSGVTSNLILGGDGNDILWATAKNDLLKGGAGDDTYIFNPGTGHDTIEDSAGNDTVDLSRDSSPIVGDLDSGAVVVPTSPLSEPPFSADAASSDSPIINHPTPGNLDETNPGNSTGSSSWWNHLFPENPLWAFNNTDWPFNSVGSAWQSLLQDVITWSPGSIENIVTGAGNDILFGNTLDNKVDAGAGNDWLTGGKGQDTLIGGAGSDTYFFHLGDGHDLIQEHPDTRPESMSDIDTIRFGTEINPDNIVFFRKNNDLQVAYSDSDVITIQNQFAATGNPLQNASSGSGIERFELTNGFYLSDHDINQLIQTMTAYAADHGLTLTNLTDIQQNQNIPILTHWHAA